MSEHDPIPPLDLSGQDDDGDQSRLTREHLDVIAGPQETDPDPGKTPTDSVLGDDLEEADDE